MNKAEITEGFDTILKNSPNRIFSGYFKTMKDGVLDHINKLEAENKIKQEIMDQQAKLIMETRDEK